MPYEYAILSPEKVELRYDLAGIGSRAMAAVLDDLIVILINALLVTTVALIDQAASFIGSLSTQVAISWLVGFYGFFLFSSWFGYYIFFEILWQGQTIGKRVLGLRVIMMDGTPATAGAIFTRELVRLVDGLPFCLVGYVVAGSVAFFNPYSQRVGDMLAGTLVIKERRTSAPSLQTLSQISSEPHPLEGLILSTGALTAQDYKALKAFLDRREQFSPKVRQGLAEELFSKLKTKLGLELEVDSQPEALLEAIASKYARDRGLLEL